MGQLEPSQISSMLSVLLLLTGAPPRLLASLAGAGAD